MKKKRGRKPNRAVLSGIKPERETWNEIRNRIKYGSSDWRIIKLRQLIGDGSKLPDNYFSLRRGQRLVALAKNLFAKLDDVDGLWNAFNAQFERAVLDGDADWFKRQARAIEKGGLPQRAQFNAKVVDLLEQAMWDTHTPKGEKRGLPWEGIDDLRVTPFQKFTDTKAGDIYQALKKRKMPDGCLLVEGTLFDTKERVMEAIHRLADRLYFALRKQH